MTDVQPSVSTDGRLLTMAFFLAIRLVPEKTMNDRLVNSLGSEASNIGGATITGLCPFVASLPPCILKWRNVTKFGTHKLKFANKGSKLILVQVYWVYNANLTEFTYLLHTRKNNFLVRSIEQTVFLCARRE